MAAKVTGLKVVGPGQITEWGDADERPHAPGPQETWQESVVLVWWDVENAIGGFYRIGHEPNKDGGPRVALWSVTFTPEGIFRKNSYLPMQASDRTPDGQGAADGGLAFRFTDHAIWTIDVDGLSAELHVHDYHAGLDGYPKTGDLVDIAPAHMEVSGAVTGVLTVRGKRYEVNGRAIRDHGWGNRVIGTTVSHRWVVGTTGPDLFFLALGFHTIKDDREVPDELVKFGWAVKGGEVIFAKSLEIVAHIEIDAHTIRGGSVAMELNNGEVLDIRLQNLAPGSLFKQHDHFVVDNLCQFTTGEGATGIACFEVTNNACRGERRPTIAYNGVMKDGWQD